MAELGLTTREKLARAIARQTGTKICPRCHLGILRGNDGECDVCKEYPPQRLKKGETLRTL